MYDSAPTTQRFVMSRQPRILRGGRIFKSGRGILSAPAIVLGAGLVLMPHGSASAADECGPVTGPNATITCSSPTTNQISYQGLTNEGVDGLTLILDNSGISPSVVGPEVAVRLRGSATSSNAISIVGTNFGTVETTNRFGYGLLARHEGLGTANVLVENGRIATTGREGDAAQAYTSNLTSNSDVGVTMIGGRIETTGDLARGLRAINDGLGAANVLMSGGEVITRGENSTATQSTVTNVLGGSDHSAITKMTGGTITTFGRRGVGLLAQASNGAGDAVVFMSGDGSVTTSGDEANATTVQATAGTGSALFTMTGGDFETTGDGAHGVNALAGRGGQAKIAVEAGNIHANGLHSDGVRAVSFRSDATVNVGGALDTMVISGGLGQGAAIRTAAIGQSVINVMVNSEIDGVASGIAIRDGDFGLTGRDDVAGVVEVNIEGGEVTGNAILGLGNDTFNLIGGDYDGDVYGDDAATAGMTLTEMVDFYDGLYTEEQLRGIDPINPVGQNDTFNWTGGTFGSSFFGGNGSDAANISAATYDGTYHVLDGGDDYAVADGWIDVLTLSGDVSGDINGANVLNWERVNFDGVSVSIVDGAFQVGSDPANGLFLVNGTELNQSGANLVLTGNMTNAASLRLQGGAVGDAVTVNGDYVGASFGTLLLDVDTATDTADTLTVTGASSGLTGITVSNLSPDTATGNDILLVSVEGASAEGDFALIGGPLIAGAFQYGLDYQAGDFVLASNLSSTGAVYEAAPHVLLDGFTRMPTLEQRVGQRRWNSAAGTLEPTSGGWLRLYGDWSEADLNTGTSYDSDSWGLQAGFDLPVEPGEHGQWVLGLTAQTGRVSAGIATAMGAGKLDAESLGFGLTGTWYGHDGTYVDLQGQVNWASVDYTSSLQGTLAEDEIARSAVASIELGRRYALDDNRGLIPQAQLVWAHLDGGNFTDSAGNAIDLGTTERVTGRLGVAYDYEWRDDARGSMQNVYGIVNILHDFSGDATVRVGGASLSSEREATQGEIGLGGSLTWDHSKTLYGELSYRRTLGGSADASALSATAGLRIQW